MTPGRYDLTCPQGTTFRKQVTWKIDDVAVNLSGYSSRLQVRESYVSNDYIVALTSASGMTLGGSAGTIDILIDDAVTALFPTGNWVYDLEVESGSGIVDRILQGNFLVTPEVTR
jgi:hypothetical protein